MYGGKGMHSQDPTAAITSLQRSYHMLTYCASLSLVFSSPSLKGMRAWDTPEGAEGEGFLC